MMTKSMRQRLRRVSAKAAKKKSNSRRSSRRSLIARLEKDSDVKSRSFDEQSGGPSGTADDQYDRKKGLPKTRGDDPKLDYTWEQGEGYPHGGDEAGLGSGAGKDLKSKKQKQKALDEADEERRKDTSEMEPLTHTKPSRPRPKVSSAKRRSWRKKKIAALKKQLDKTAFNAEGDPEMKKMFSDMEQGDSPAAKPTRTKGVADKSTRVSAFKIHKTIAKFLPKMQEANDNLEMAVTGGKTNEITAAMVKLMSTSRFVIKNVLIPQGGQMTKLLSGLRQASVKDKRFTVIATRLARMDAEFSRSRTLIRMAASYITL